MARYRRRLTRDQKFVLSAAAAGCCWQPVTARAARRTPLQRHPPGPGSRTSSSPTHGRVAATAGPAARRRAWTSCGRRKAGSIAYAANPTSDARGIPQNINGWSAGYQPGNASQQIAWGLAYIAGRYGYRAPPGPLNITCPELVLSPAQREACSALEQEPGSRWWSSPSCCTRCTAVRPEDLARAGRPGDRGLPRRHSFSARRSPLSCRESPRCSGTTPAKRRTT